MNGRKAATIACSVAALGVLVSILVNLGTDLLPEGWTWTKDPLVVWPVIGALFVLLCVLSWRGSREVESTNSSVTPQTQIVNSGPGVINYYDNKAGQPEARELFAGSPPSVRQIPPRVTDFVARDNVLSQIQGVLSRRHERCVCVLTGMGGVGKTQLAIEYTQRCAAEYELIYWIEAANVATLPQQIAEIGVSLNIATDIGTAERCRIVLDYLSARTGWLLIFDNADILADLLAYIPRGKGHLLLTTRSAEFATLGTSIDVDVFERTESLELIQTRDGRASSRDATSLAELLGDLPLALEQAMAYLNYSGLTIGRYTELWKKRSEELLSRGDVAGYDHTVATTWNVSIDRLQRDMPISVWLLESFSFLAPQLVPLFLFSESPSSFPEPLRSCVRDELALVDAVGALVRLSLCRRYEHDDDPSVIGVLTHRLVLAATRAQIPEERRATLVASLTEAMRVIAPVNSSNETELWPWWQVLGAHVVELTTYAERYEVAPEARCLLLSEAGSMAYRSGDFAHAKSMLERAQLLAVRVYGEQSRPHAKTLDDVAKVAEELGDRREALKLRERAYRISVAQTGRNSEESMTYLSHFASALSSLDQVEQAEPHLRRYQEWARQNYGEESPEFGHASSHLASLLQKVGRREDAYSAEKVAYRLARSAKNPKDLELASTANSLGVICFEMGRHEEAVRLLEEAAQKYSEVYGLDHPVLAATMTNLGSALRAFGQEEQALVILERALELAREHGRENSEDVLGGMLSLAGLKASMDDFQDAEKLYRETIDRIASVLGPNHRTMARALSNYSVLLFRQERYGEVKNCLSRSIRISESLSELPPEELARRHRLLGQAYLKVGDAKNTQRSFKRSLRLYERSRDAKPQEIAELRELLAQFDR